MAAWLQMLLEERYGLPIIVSQIDNAWCLSMSEGECTAHIESDPDTFTRADSVLPIAVWDAESESWKPILNSAIPLLGAATLHQPIIEQTESGYRIHYAMLGLTY